jgi:hypothetical protein
MKILTIVPSRHRPDSVNELIEEINATACLTDLVIGVDDDDESEYIVPENVILEVNPRMWMNGTLNFIAKKYCNDYDSLVFMGDDHRPRTENWDSLLAETIKDVPMGIAYGTDLFQGENLPTAVMLDAEIVRRLGFFSPPPMKHLFLDNFWRDTGKSLETLRYSPEIIIEHMHPYIGKTEMDAGYAEVNSPEIGSHDQLAYMKYLSEDFQNDLDKLRK